MKPFIKESFFKTIKYILVDGIAIIASYLFTALILDMIGYRSIYNPVYKDIVLFVAIVVISKLIIFYLFGFYRILTKYISFEDVAKISIVIVITNILIGLIVHFSKIEMINSISYVIITFIEATLIVVPRILRRIWRYALSYSRLKRPQGIPTLIIGAGSAGEIALREFNKNHELFNIPKAFIDDDKTKIGHKLMGVPVYGPISEIQTYIEKFQIKEVVMAIASLKHHKFQEIMDQLLKLHVKVKRLNMINDATQAQVVDVKVEDLLDREIIELDNAGLSDLISGEVVLVTGGGGSIGSELCRQIFDLKPKTLIIFDIYENNAYDIQMELLRKKSKNNETYSNTELVVRIGSVYNKERLENIYKDYRPTVVFHAAAYKHVPLMEDSSVEAVRTNVIGTYYASSLANQYGVKKFVLVSSDKAVRSTNVMGATKRFAELIITDQNKLGKTSFSAVRFGNVLGSNGSVIPLFKKQISDGGPVTVTHKDITRYFMTIPEAVGLILQSGVYAKGGELFILDMGSPVKIYDLAVKMITLAGYKVGIDMNIEVTGLRPGEKLYEELLVDTNSENHIKTDNKKIFVEKQQGIEHDKLILDDIIHNFEHLSNDQIKDLVASIVTTYHKTT